MPIKFGSRPIKMLWLLGWFAAAAAALADAPRTISLAPHLTELVYAVDAEQALVGVVAWSDYPPEARHLPQIGDAFRFDLEAVLAVKAEQALAWTGGTPPEAARRLQQLGVTVHWINTRSLADIEQALRQIGALMGQDPAGQRAAGRFAQAVAHHRHERPVGPALRVFYQVSSQPLMTLGGQHVINELLDLCGAENVFADLSTEASAVDREAVLARAPEVVLIGHNGDADAVQVDPILATGRPVIALHADLLVRPSPRLLLGIEQLCSVLDSYREDRF